MSQSQQKKKRQEVPVKGPSLKSEERKQEIRTRIVVVEEFSSEKSGAGSKNNVKINS